MMLRVGECVIACALLFAYSGGTAIPASPSASVPVNASIPRDPFCEDLSTKSSLYFSGSSRIRCSPNIYGCPTTVSCDNTNRGNPSPTWRCTAYGVPSGYHLLSTPVNCELCRNSSYPASYVNTGSCVVTLNLSRSSTGTIIGAIIGALVLVALVIGLIAWGRSRRMGTVTTVYPTGINTTTRILTSPAPVFVSAPPPPYHHHHHHVAPPAPTVQTAYGGTTYR